MATSGTVTFRSTRDTLINLALIKVNALDPENTSGATANQISNAALALNMMVKGWEAEGLQLWERKYGVIFLQPAQQFYVLGSPGPAGDHACLSTPLGTGYIQTTLSATAAASASTVSVVAKATAGTVGVPAITADTTYTVGVVLNTGAIAWSTISNVSSLVISLGTNLPSAATIGNTVFFYKTKLMRPLRILDGFVRQFAGSDVPCRMISRDEYNRYGQKSSTGTPIQLYYDPQENSGNLYVYPASSDARSVLFIEFQKPIEDFTSSTDDFDLPQEWQEAIVFNLAWRLAVDYSVPKDKYLRIKEMALAFFMRLDGYDQEPASVFLQPSNWAYNPGNGGNK